MIPCHYLHLLDDHTLINIIVQLIDHNDVTQAGQVALARRNEPLDAGFGKEAPEP